jgi:hypothetical protein
MTSVSYISPNMPQPFNADATAFLVCVVFGVGAGAVYHVFFEKLALRGIRQYRFEHP